MPRKIELDREEIMKAMGDEESEEGEPRNQDQKREPQPQKRQAGDQSRKQVTGREKPASGRPEERKDDKGKDAKSRRTLVLSLSIGGAFLVAAAVVGYVVLGRGNPPAQENANVENSTPTSKLVPRRIDGVLDDPEDQNRFPVAIMVENHTSSRPQSGLDKANIVFEALAEGGITRFMGIFTLTDPVTEIGPVRSARPYFVDWARAYNPLYAHIGGSPKALNRIATTEILDLNQFFNSQYFWRDKSRDVATEHTLYTSSKLMARAIIDKQVPTQGNFTPWKYKEDASTESRPASQHLTINFSTFSYKVDYEYDPVLNSYVRSVGEQPHVMRDGTQLRPKNVVLLTVKRRLEEPVDGQGRLEMDTVGDGPARYFLDGQEFQGTWRKRSPQDLLELTREGGAEPELNVGQTWVEVVPPDQEVTAR